MATSPEDRPALVPPYFRREPLPEQAITPAGPGLLRCALHGIFRSHLRDGAVRALQCWHCGKDRMECRTPADAIRNAEALHMRRLDECGLVGRYRQATFDTFEAPTPAHRTVREACREYAQTAEEGVGGNLMLLGPVGTGKTHLLAAMARHLRLERAVMAKVATPRNIIKALRATWAKGSEQSEASVLAEYVEGSEVLMLDEAGLGFGSDGELVQLYDVIDGRYARNLPTVVASNLSAAAMKDTLGDRIFDRLRENATVYAMEWPSYRGRKA